MPVFFYKLYQVFFTPFPIWVTGLVIPRIPQIVRDYTTGKMIFKELFQWKLLNFANSARFPVNMNGKSGRTMYMDIAAGENMYSPDAHMLSEKSSRQAK